MWRLFHLVRGLAKGPHGRLVSCAALMAVFAGCALTAGLVYTPLWMPAVALTWFVVVALLTLLLVLTNLLRGKINDVGYAASLEAGLRRAGYEPIDLFMDGGAANPSLQLFHFKVLRLVRPNRVLELGSGQTTKLLSCYVRENPSAQALTLEQDGEWVARLKDSVGHEYRHVPLEPIEFTCPEAGMRLTASWYKDVPEMHSSKFNYILVDGPDRGMPGTSYTPYARAGILHYMPQILAESFVVVFDDAERAGERMTADAFQRILDVRGVRYVRFSVYGSKTQVVFCSPDLAFLRSV